jgi:hypothetical protein
MLVFDHRALPYRPIGPGLWAKERAGLRLRDKGTGRPETGWDKTLAVFREAYQLGNEDNRTRTTRGLMYPRTPRA